MNKKYKLTEESIDYFGRKLYRVEALKDFDCVDKGDKGGYVESEENLSQEGDCWVFGDTKVYGNAKVLDNAAIFDNALVYGNAQVYGNAEIFGNTYVFDNAKICGNARVYGNAIICRNAVVKNNSDYIIFKNWWSSGRFFTWTRSNNMWKVGCFYGTGEELIAEAYKNSELSGREYKRIVDYVESIL